MNGYLPDVARCMMIAKFLNMPYKPCSVYELPQYDLEMAFELRNVIAKVKSAYGSSGDEE